MGTIFVDNIKQQSSQGSGTITIGASGETVSFASGVTGTNYPAFECNLNGQTFNIANSTLTKVIMTNEVLDTNSAYDTSTGRFTPQVAGTYFVYGQIAFDSTSDFDNIEIMLRKNESTTFGDALDRNEFHTSLNAHGVVSLNGSSDHITLHAKQVSGGTVGLLDSGNGSTCTFGAFRIGT